MYYINTTMGKRKIVMLYGEKTVLLKSRRIPESKKHEIEAKIDLLLLGYHNLKVVEIDCEESDQSKAKDIASEKPTVEEIKTNEMAAGKVVAEPKWKQNLEKKSNPTDDTVIEQMQNGKVVEGDFISASEIKNTIAFKVKPKFTPNATRNEVNMDALREIANGKGVKSELFATKKKPIDEIYDCIAVTRGIPDISERIYASAKSQIAFWDRDDNTVFYVNWENKYYRFVNSNEFNRFLKDQNIK